MANRVPVAGYPSKRAAVCDMVERQGRPKGEVARELGLSLGAVEQHLRKQRRAGGAVPPPASPMPIAMTPDRARKVRWLFARTMLLIADKMQMTPAELVDVGLKGLIRPAKGRDLIKVLQRIAEYGDSLDADDEAEPVEPDPDDGAVFGPGRFEGPSRDEDEAELAQLEEDSDGEEADEVPEVEPDGAAAKGRDGAGGTAGDELPRQPGAAGTVAPEAGRLYYLTRGDGYYLHESIEQLTSNRRYAWKGTTKHMAAVIKAKPQWRELEPERVPAP